MTTRKQEILGRIRAVAKALGNDLQNVVFVGGAAISLYPEPSDLRMTTDVDVVVNATLSEYHRLISRLKKAGFKECRDEAAPVCRYEYQTAEERLLVDVMPASGKVLGFSSAWYGSAVQRAESVAIGEGLNVRVISPLYLVATKLEAFASRGKADFLASHDLEDAILVLEATPTLFADIAAGQSEVSAFVRTELARLVQIEAFCDAVVFSFENDESGSARATRLLDALQSLAQP